MEQKSALLAGASGLIGGHCLRILLDEPAYTRVTIIVRRQLMLSHDKLVQYAVDFDDLELVGEALTADDVYCCLGTTIKKAGTRQAFCRVDFDYPVKLAALTQHCDAQQFLLVTALGANAHSRIFYNRVKGDVEEAIQKIPFSGLHIFRPSLLLGERNEQRSGEKVGSVLMSGLKYVMGGPLRKYRPIQARDVAKAMVQVAQKNLTDVNIFESDHIQAIANGMGI